MNFAELRALVATLIGCESAEIDPDENLIGYGMDSISAMRLGSRLRRAGIAIATDELAATPTLTHWWSLISARLPGERSADASANPAADPATANTDPAISIMVDESAPFALTPVQHAYWIGRRSGQVLGDVGCHAYLEFDSDGVRQRVDPDRLERAVRRLIARHPQLRTRFLDDGTQQVIPNSEPSPWRGLTVHDLRVDERGEADHAEAERRLVEIRDGLSHRVFEAERGEVMDVQLSLLPGGATRVHFELDLLVADVLSLRIALTDLARLYGHPDTELPPIDYGFARYQAERDADRAASGAFDRDRDWWSNRLAEMPGGPKLPLATAPESVKQPRFVRRRHRVETATWRRVQERAAAAGLTASTVLAAAYAEVLAAWSAEPKFLLNLPLFDRQDLHHDVGALVADFTSLVLLEVDLSESAPFAERARRIQRRLHEDLAHTEFSGVEVLREAARQRPDDPRTAPVVFASNLDGELVDPEFRETFGELGWMISQTPQVWLDNQLVIDNRTLLICWDAVEELFPAGVLDAMFDAHRNLVEWLADGDWSQPAPVSLPEDQRTRRESVNNTGTITSDASNALLHDGFFAQARETPERIALRWGSDESMTYGELAESASRVAAVLRDRGVGAGALVGVSLPKGADQFAAVLGVLATGAAYVPLGVDQPPVRRERMCATTGVRRVIVANDSDAASWSDSMAVHTMESIATHSIAMHSSAGHSGAGHSSVAVVPVVPPISKTSTPELANEPAYVIFTSGSSGEPKGVEVTHAAAMNTIADVNARYGVGADDRVLAVSALDFDLSVYDVFGLLGAGGSVVLIDESQRRDPERWLELVRRHGVTVWNSVPTLWEMLVTAAEGTDAPVGIRLVLVSGDWVGLDLPARTSAVTGPDASCRFVALGGATEAAIWSNAYEVDTTAAEWNSIPYGFPLANQCFRVVDARGRDCPDWVPGELWIGGAGVATGYRGQPALTASRFVTWQGRRWYRTGDLGRYWPDGTLEFLGRADQQVKIRGHRIELGEIEAALHALSGVRRAAAVVDAGRRQLTAAIVWDGAPSPGTRLADIANSLRDVLPDYMVPEEFVALDTLPLTPNGKLDRAALSTLLPALLSERRSEAGPLSREPIGPIETAVARVWAEQLGIGALGNGVLGDEAPIVDRYADFFRVGGDSLIATRVAARLRSIGLEGVELAALFRTPVLAEFAASLSGRPRFTDGTVGTEGTEDTAAVVPDPENRHESFALTEIQRAYWIGRSEGLTLGGAGTTFFMEFDGERIDVPRLETAANRLVQRHDMLRAVIDTDGTQRVLAEVPRFEIPTEDAPDAESAGAALSAALSQRAFEWGSWPLIELRVVHYGDLSRLGVAFDYSVIDAFSGVIFLRELARFYVDPAREMPPLAVTFRDYVRHAETSTDQLAAAESYWRDRLDTLPPAPALPLVTDPETVTAPVFTRRRYRLDAERWSRLKDRARAFGVTPSAVLLAAYGEILARWSGNTALTMNLTLFDRPGRGEAGWHPDIDGVLGDFTSLLPVEYHAAGPIGWGDAVRALAGRLASDLDHRAISTVWVQRELAKREIPAPGVGTAGRGVRHPGFPVVFTSTLGVTGESAGSAGSSDSLAAENAFGRQVGGLSQTPQVWLDQQVGEDAGDLVASWDAVTELFPAGVLDEMLAAYGRMLEWAADADWSESVPDVLPASQREIRDRINDTGTPESGRLVHEAFFARATERPERIALRWGTDSSLTYGELAERASRIASALIFGGVVSGGVTSGRAVGVSLPKGPDQIAAVLGVLAAGCVYVPMSVDLPLLRRERMISAAGISTVLVGEQVDGPAWPAEVNPLSISDAMATPAAPLSVRTVDPGDPAYVIFTSGSSGTPKGVEIAHRSAVNTVEDINDRFQVGAGDRVLAVSALDFDLSVFDVFGVLGAGGSLVLIGEGERRDPERWLELVRRHGVSVWNSVPALWDMVVTAAEGAGVRVGVRLVLVSGDWVGLDLPGRTAVVASGSRFVALGGATEAAIWSNAFEVGQVDPDWVSVPYGFPLRNQRFRVVDTAGRDCPDWVAGELWIGGVGVATGYRGDPDLTAERFVVRDGDRWYRTGDMGRYWPDGTLEFLGRADQQVKIRGHRIELGEIETALREHPSIEHAIAFPSEDRRHLYAAITESLGRHETEASSIAGYDDRIDPSWAAEEAMLAEFLRSLLDACGLAAPTTEATSDGELENAGVRPELHAVVREWSRWLANYHSTEQTHSSHPATARIGEGLLARVPDFAAMLRGEMDPLVLLDDPILAPEAQAAARPEAGTVIEHLAAEFGAYADRLGRPLRVAELGARSGEMAARLLSTLGESMPAGSIEYTLLDESPTLLDAARARLAAMDISVDIGPRFHQLRGSVIGPELRHRFDLVVAPGSLHRWVDRDEASRIAVSLLAAGGGLYVWEPARLAPLATPVVTILGAGTDALSPPAAWANTLAEAGLRDVSFVTQAHQSVLLRGIRPADRPGIDDDAIRASLADRLPSYMIPERLVTVAKIPLSANGKIDRSAVRRLVSAAEALEVSTEADELVTDIERVVARVWAEFFEAPELGRGSDFFLLGGDSLAATRLVARLRDAGLDGVRLADLFRTPVLADFASGLRMADTGAGALEPSQVEILAEDRENRHEPFPLTEVQRAYWLGRREAFALGGVGSHCYFEFEADQVDLARLEDAVNRLIDHHAMLRAVVTDDGQQRVLPAVSRFVIPVTQLNADAADSGEFAEAAAKLREVMSHQVIDLSTWPLVDIRAVRTADGRTVFGIGMDNFVLDGLSMMTVLAQLAELYRNPAADLPTQNVSFRDYVVATVGNPDRQEAARRYWRERLPRLPSAPALPLTVDPAAIARPRFERREHVLPAQTWARITERAAAHGLTPSAVLLSCYSEVLGAWSGQPGLTVNVTLFDRPQPGQPGGHPDIHRVVGDFTSLVLVEHQRSAAGWLTDARATQVRLAEAVDHREVSAVWVQREWAKVAESTESAGAATGMPVVFTSALGLDDDLFDAAFAAPWQQRWAVSQTPQVWLDHQVMERRGSLVLCWDAVAELFPAGMLDAMFAAYVERLDGLADSDWESAAVPMAGSVAGSVAAPALIPDSQWAVRRKVNDTAGPESGASLHQAFFAHARENPDAAALIVDGAEPVSYRELADRALRVAGRLRAAGVGPGSTVAVTVAKGVDQIAAVLGVLAAGGTYVPVGVDQPARRRNRIYHRADVSVVLVDENVMAAAAGEWPDAPVAISVTSAIDDGVRLTAPALVDPGDPAYVIFTSGSSGEPKGVEVAHRSAVNTVEDINDRFQVGAGDRVLAVSALDFDLSVFDVFGVLGAGGSLVLIDESERRDPERWLELVRRHGVSVWNSVPALWDMVVTAAEGVDVRVDVRLVMVSGDWVGLDLPGRTAEVASGSRFVAMGGATEAAIWSNAFEVGQVDPDWVSIPYGFPLRNQRFRVVDTAGRDCPDWVAGELWIGGVGVATGYRGDADLTAERFVVRDGDRWYRTGDMGRYWPDGTLEFLGRADQQVKIRGHRIELGEIETALREHPSIDNAVAMAVGERGQRRLVAFCRTNEGNSSGAALVDDELVAFLASRIPSYAIPSSVVRVDEFPLTGNGKINVSALRELADSATADDFDESSEAPNGPVEEAIAAVWAELLAVPSVGRRQSFFALGGDSLLATRFVEAMRRRYDLRVSLRGLFADPTVAGLATTVQPPDRTDGPPAGPAAGDAGDALEWLEGSL